MGFLSRLRNPLADSATGRPAASDRRPASPALPVQEIPVRDGRAAGGHGEAAHRPAGGAAPGGCAAAAGSVSAGECMELFVIDTEDPRERWEELYRAVEERLSNPRTLHEPRPRPLCIEIDPLEVLHIAYWNGA